MHLVCTSQCERYHNVLCISIYFHTCAALILATFASSTIILCSIHLNILILLSLTPFLLTIPLPLRQPLIQNPRTPLPKIHIQHAIMLPIASQHHNHPPPLPSINHQLQRRKPALEYMSCEPLHHFRSDIDRSAQLRQKTCTIWQQRTTHTVRWDGCVCHHRIFRRRWRVRNIQNRIRLGLFA
jgi:hypothetical protein